jgi:transposase-like protein
MCFGRSASYYERLLASVGRFQLVGTTVKQAGQLPTQLVADEKITWEAGREVLLATTVAQGCFLGAALASETSAAALEKAYGEFKTEAQDLAPGYTPETVTTDGFRPTRLAWQTLFPQMKLILCFLHGILKIAERCRGQLRHTVLDHAWRCYDATTAASFAQRLRRFDEWAQAHLSGAVLEMAQKLRTRRTDYQTAYAHPGAARTTNAVDRLMNFLIPLDFVGNIVH